MICYRDKTFCLASTQGYEGRCRHDDCWRYFGKEQQEGARRWWDHDPDNAPVAFADFKEECPDYESI